MMKSALTVAGSDSGGGAGIQADLRAFAALGVHGSTVLTCITAQNTRRVLMTHAMPSEVIEAQFRALREDIPMAAAKTGMLYSPEIVRVASRNLSEMDIPLVVDPVMVATVGARLHSEGFVAALKEHLLPIATVITPNLDEASALVGREVKDLEAMEGAAKEIRALGPRYVLVKGGHLQGDLVDVLYDGDRMHRLRGFRHPKELHGSGCVLSALVAGGLALGYGVPEAVEGARRRVASGFDASYSVGRGVEVINAHPPEDRYEIQQAIGTAAVELTTLLPLALIPEVGVNIGYALPGARSPEDVCALPGRIVRSGDHAEAVGCPGFGTSRHVARIILAAIAFDPRVRSAMNMKYTPEFLDACRGLGLHVGTFDRAKEPEGSSTMEWGTTQAISALGFVPEIIYDLGGFGKVPMIRVLGRRPSEVVQRVREIIEATRQA